MPYIYWLKDSERLLDEKGGELTHTDNAIETNHNINMELNHEQTGNRISIKDKLIEMRNKIDKPKNITLTVAECGEFPNMGELHKDIESVDKAIEIFNSIPPERMNGIPGISVNVHAEGTNPIEDIQIDIVSGNKIDLEMLTYIPEIRSDKNAMSVITELVNKMPNADIIGSLEVLNNNPLAKVEELEEENYNMIDGVINNEKPKKLENKISFKEKLDEVKDIITHKQHENKNEKTHNKLVNVL